MKEWTCPTCGDILGKDVLMCPMCGEFSPLMTIDQKAEEIVEEAKQEIDYDLMQLHHYKRALVADGNEHHQVQLQIAWDTNRIANALEAIAMEITGCEPV